MRKTFVTVETIRRDDEFPINLFFINLVLFFNRAVIILAIVITIAVLVTRHSDDDLDNDSSPNTNPAKFMSPADFLVLMESFNGTIPGS